MVTEAAEDAIIEGMKTDTPHTSFSRLNDFLACPFRYMLKYEMGIKGQTSVNMARGTAGHKVLEINARHKIKTGEDLSLEEIQDRFNKQFDVAMMDVEVIEDDPGIVRDSTQKILEEYMKKEAPLVTPLACEVEFLLPVPKINEDDEDVPDILGYIDIINKRGELSEMLDRKFPSRKPSGSQDRADIGPQITVYDMALTAAGTPTDLIGFENYIPPTKTIKARIERFYRSPALMTPEARAARHARLTFQLRQMYGTIKTQNYYPVDDPNVCGNCDVRRLCQNSLVKDDYEHGKFTTQTFRNKEKLWQAISSPNQPPSPATAESSSTPQADSSPAMVASPLRKRNRTPPPPLRKTSPKPAP